ncbi:NDR1/HIN1-like protein 13 [Aristolochia californica]|uniref:NDR1/HIN1-like protein 13 n=1 Tax=Aristolochia californica TaxID=171875 RepID=UPI0035DCA114
MADRVHPRTDSPPVTVTATATSGHPPEPAKSDVGGANPVPSFAPKPQPPPGTYVVQVPKDQIYRVPTPGNAHKYRNAARRKNRGCCGCCCCMTYILSFLFILVIILGIVAAVFYLTVRPKAPKYSVDSISITGFNLSASNLSLSLSPEFDVTVRAENPNKGIGIYYGKKSSVTVSHSDVQLCNGVLPSFYQGTRNVTIFTTVLKGSSLRLSDTVHDALISQQRKGQIPMKLDLKVPVKVKVWGIKSWSVDVNVNCDVTVNKLARDSRVISRDCHVDVDPWWW